MVGTTLIRRRQRVSNTSSLRMLVIVLKPISGTNSPSEISAVTPASRNARRRRGGGAAGAMASSGISHLLHVGPAENALRHEDHHDRQDRKGGNVLVGEGHVFAPQGLDDADQEAAEHGARQRADAAEHRRRE